MLASRLQPLLDPTARQWLADAGARVKREGSRCLPELFPQLPRRVGREPFATGTLETNGQRVDLGAWRRCDAAAHHLLAREPAPDELEVELFLHGDLEERTMVLRCLALLPVTDATLRLLGEVQRTNMVVHFEAAACDSNLLVRALASGRLPAADFNRTVLKLAFLDLPLHRAFDVLEHGNADLTRMLQGLATEREAAGRPVWVDTNRLIARAPVEGTLARLVGHLEHGDDRQRLAAAEALAWLRPASAAALVRERLPREPRADVKTALQRALSKPA